MNQKTILPMDLPRDCTHIIAPMSDELKKQLNDFTDKALSEGRWGESEDMLFNPADLEFAAYWVYKTIHPIVKPMKGSGLEAYFAPFKATEKKWLPEDFEVEENYTLSASGDLMFAKYIAESKDKLYSRVEDFIFNVDCSYVNLESTLSTKPPEKLFAVEKQGETPAINITNPEYNTLMKHMGHQFDIAQIANNHIMDCGEEGAITTMNQLREDGVTFLGVYDTEEKSKQVTTTMMGNIKIGWVAHTFSLNGKPLPEGKPWYCDVTPFHEVRDPDTTRIEQQIQAAKDEGCDLVILTLHWGMEHEFFPQPVQLKWAHQFAELGADAIIGHHPHVCQPYEIYHPKSDPSKAVPILYSLGNLVPAYAGAATVLSMVGRLTISRGRMNGTQRTMVTGIEMTPVAFMRELEGDNSVASLVTLKALNELELDAETRKYVSEINTYASLLLGNEWR